MLILMYLLHLARNGRLLFCRVAHYEFLLCDISMHIHQVDKTSLLMDLIAALQAQARRFTSVGHTDGSTGDVFVRSLSSVELLDGKNTVCLSVSFSHISMKKLSN